MSASIKDVEFEIEFIECKGNFVDYIYWYLRRFVKYRSTADAITGIYIARVAGRDHASGVTMFEKSISTNIGRDVDQICLSVPSATVTLPQCRKEPDSSYVSLISHILRIFYGIEIHATLAMEYRMIQPRSRLNEIPIQLFCGSHFQIENIVLMSRSLGTLTVNSFDSSPERMFCNIAEY
jgi:hypothetical protein